MPSNRHVAAALCLYVIPAGVVAAMAPRFAVDGHLVFAPVIEFTLVQIAWSTGFVFLIWYLPRSAAPVSVALLLLIGLGLRLLFIGSEPILETDYFRYLLDGYLTSQGENPWRYSPSQLLAEPGLVEDLPRAASYIIERVNHPELTSIYPPGAQLLFATAALIQPFDLDPWRWLILICECLSLALLIVLLQTLRLPLLWASLWWLNPLVIRESINTAHIDALLVPVVLGAVLAIINRRGGPAIVLIAIATSIKLWPAVLCLWLFRGALAGRLIKAVTLGFVMVALCVTPLLLTNHADSSGLVAYASRWDTNGGVFQVLRALASSILGPGSAQPAARAITVLLFAAVLLNVVRQTGADHYHRVADARRQAQQIAIAVFALFLLSPSAYPWYFLWAAPLLVAFPNWSALSLVCLLPLYYLRFYFGPRGEAWIFDSAILALQFAPVFLLLLLEYSGRLQPALRFPPANES